MFSYINVLKAGILDLRLSVSEMPDNMIYLLLLVCFATSSART